MATSGVLEVPVVPKLYIPDWLRDALLWEGWTPPPDEDRTQAGP